MHMSAWEEIVSHEVSEIFNGDAGESAVTVPVRPWPPVMIRDLITVTQNDTRDVDSRVSIGYVADFLAENRTALIAVYDEHFGFIGIACDEDVMALIKRFGVCALDFPIAEAVQRNRPVCSGTDSPYVVLNLMQSEGWDRIGVSERGDVIGMINRRDLVKFAEIGKSDLHSHR